MVKTTLRDVAAFIYDNHALGDSVEERDESRRLAFFRMAQKSPIIDPEDLLVCWRELERLISQLPHKG